MSDASDVLTGECRVLRAWDIGKSVDLVEGARLLQGSEVLSGARRPHSPGLFHLEPQPFSWTATPVVAQVAGREIEVHRRAVVYDFGQLSVDLHFDVSGPLTAWRDLGVALEQDARLRALAEPFLRECLERLGPAITEPHLSPLYEEYTVFQVPAVPGGDTEAWLADNAQLVVQMLRGEALRFSDAELEAALRQRLSYARSDLAVIDWASALVVEPHYSDILAVLDFANSEVLGLRVLDRSLDSALEAAERLIRTRPRLWELLFRPQDKATQRLAELTTAAAAEFEAVNNPLKLTGDEHLARIYRLAAERFQLEVYDRDVERKLQTLWNIHGVFHERTMAQRSEWLEWIIILLIAFEVVKSLL